MAELSRSSTRGRAVCGVGLVVWCLLLLTLGCSPADGPGAPPAGQAEAGVEAGVGAGVETVPVELAGRAFEVELALDPASRLQGLSDRPVVPEDGGMLFVFPDVARRTFVMRRCLVPIDIAYLDDAGRVVRTHAMAVEAPGTPEHRLRHYPSRYPARYALELAGGTLAELDLQPGDPVTLPPDLVEQAE